MKFITTDFKDLIIIKHNVFNDQRGFFKEQFKKENLERFINGKINFCQENCVKSYLNVLRGLHFQKEPYAQSKLVSVSSGSILDVVVDIRKNSKTFGKYKGFILSDEGPQQILIPHGFAHGFCVLSDYAIFAYKVDNYYSPNHEFGIRWDDCNLNIDWGYDEKKIQLSKKDIELPLLTEIDSPFKFSQ